MSDQNQSGPRTCKLCGLPLHGTEPDAEHFIVFSPLHPHERDRYRAAHPNWRRFPIPAEMMPGAVKR